LKNNYLFIVGAFLSVLICSCNKKPKEKLSNLLDNNIFNTSTLIEKITQETVRQRREDTPAKWADTLYEFYEKRAFEPVWAMQLADGAKRQEILTFIQQVALEGLDPTWYDYTEIKVLFERLAGFVPSDSLYLMLAEAEWKISNAFVSLNYDHCFGRTDPKEIFGDNYLLPRRTNSKFALFDVLNSKNYNLVYSRSEPPQAEYDSLKNMLGHYADLHKKGTQWSIIDTTGITRIDPGDTIAIMPAIANKLFELGFIDSTTAANVSPIYYEKSFAKYIRKFQTTYGLFDDGIIGRNTLDLINLTIKEISEEIACNMERLRWFEADTSNRPFILVNQPEFMLYMHYQDSIKSMRVCIGKQNSHNYDYLYKKYQETKKFSDKPKNFETPQIYSRISHIVLNPTWTVPASIVAREMYPQIRRDKNYLRRNNYTVIYKDKPVPNQDTINWARYSATNIPYKFVQGAGDDNALGAVKFMFPNPFFIYLHDTPQKSKFKITERSVSHGCVRVEEPLNLALFLSQNIEKYDYDDFRIIMGYPPIDEERLKEYDPLDSMALIKKITATTSIFLNERVPVYFDYRTIWWDDEGKLQMRSDVYRRNKKIVSAMQKKQFKLIKNS
jgi:L,D-transpeptidase YcbB